MRFLRRCSRPTYETAYREPASVAHTDVDSARLIPTSVRHSEVFKEKPRRRRRGDNFVASVDATAASKRARDCGCSVPPQRPAKSPRSVSPLFFRRIANCNRCVTTPLTLFHSPFLPSPAGGNRRGLFPRQLFGVSELHEVTINRCTKRLLAMGRRSRRNGQTEAFLPHLVPRDATPNKETLPRKALTARIAIGCIRRKIILPVADDEIRKIPTNRKQRDNRRSVLAPPRPS